MSGGLPSVMGRIAALALLGALLALVWVFGLGPLLDQYRNDREAVAFAAEQLPRLQRQAAEMPLLRAEVDRAASDPAAQQRLLAGASEALAGAELQNRITLEARRFGLAMRSAQILPPTDEEAYRRIGVRVALEGDIAGLRGLLYAVETSKIFLFVDNLEIRSRSGGRVVRRNDLNQPQEEILAIRFDVTGYQRRPAP